MDDVALQNAALRPADPTFSDGVAAFMQANPLDGTAPKAPAQAPAAAQAPVAPAASAAPAAAPAPAPAQAPADAPVAPSPNLRPGFSVQELIDASRSTPVAPSPVEDAPDGPEADPDAPAEAQKDGPARNAWTKIKGENKTLRTQLETLKRQYEEVAAKPAVDPAIAAEVERLRQQTQEYENTIGQLEITRSKAFQQRYDAKIMNLRTKAVQRIAEASDRSPEDAASMLRALEQAKTPQEARELVAGEPSIVQGTAFQAYLEIREAFGERQRAIEDWRNTRPTIETEAERESDSERLRRIVDATATALPVLVAPPDKGGENSWIYMDQPEDVEWTARRQGLLSAARAILRDNRPGEVEKMVLEGVAAKVYREFGESQYARVKELEASLARRNKATPRVNGGGSSEGSTRGNHVPLPAVSPQSIEAGVGELIDNFHRELAGQ